MCIYTNTEYWPEHSLNTLIGGNVKYFHFALKNSFHNIQPFLKILFQRKPMNLLKLGMHCFVIFTKIKYLEFS